MTWHDLQMALVQSASSGQTGVGSCQRPTEMQQVVLAAKARKWDLALVALIDSDRDSDRYTHGLKKACAHEYINMYQ